MSIDRKLEDAKNLDETATELSQKGTLTRPLYDLLHNKEGGANRSLQTTEEMLRRGNAPEAAQLGQRVGRSMENLKQGVEHAAESVLGDDTESLRLAKKELDDLAQQLNREISQATPSTNNPAQSQAGDTGGGVRPAGSDRTVAR